MTDALIVPMSFYDFKVIKTRKQAQFIFEVPLEKGMTALEALGGLSKLAVEQWVGIVPITAEAAKQWFRENVVIGDDEQPVIKAETAQESASAETDEGKDAVKHSIMLAKNVFFWKWIDVSNEADAAKYIRWYCQIDSRRDLATNLSACRRFAVLRNTFRGWKDYPNYVSGPLPMKHDPPVMAVVAGESSTRKDEGQASDKARTGAELWPSPATS